jgi:hypothetical protein
MDAELNKVFKDSTQLLGFIWHKWGEEGIRHTLNLGYEAHLSKESFAKTAEEFREAGLIKAAEIIDEFAAKAPDEKETVRCHASDATQLYSELPEKCPMLGQWKSCVCLTNRKYTRY